MANLNTDSVKQRTFDAIVIGSGMSGGWAAKELTDNGLKTLIVERGRDVKHIIDYRQLTYTHGSFRIMAFCLWMCRRPIPLLTAAMPLAKIPLIFL